MKKTLSIICVSLLLTTLLLGKLAVLVNFSGRLESPRFPIAKEASAKQEETSSTEKVDFKIFQSLQRQRLELAKREEKLSNEEYRLKTLKDQIADKIEQLNKIRDEINKRKESAVAQPKEEKLEVQADKSNKPKEDKIGQLAKIYEATPPEQAGPLLEKLDAKVAAMILMKMNERKAGKILGFVNPANAAKLSEEMVK